MKFSIEIIKPNKKVFLDVCKLFMRKGFPVKKINLSEKIESNRYTPPKLN